MKALKYILLLVLVLIIGFSIYIAVQPNSFEVTRTRSIKAPQEVIYNKIIDFKTWENWSSWVEADPEMTLTIPENHKGVGGSYSWEDKNGVGTMTTVAANPYSSITQEMQIAEYPKSDVSWQLSPNDDGSTEVTWNIKGENLPFIFKAISTVMGGMEKQIGPHYERGLEKLDSIVQADMKVYSINVEGVTQHSGGFYLYNTASCKFSEFETTMKTMLPKVGAYAITHNVTMAGPAFILYHKWDEQNDAVIFSCCVPTTSKIVSQESGILTGQLASFKAVKTTLKGDYKNLKEAWETAMTYITENNLEMIESGPMLESYITDPMSQPNPADWVTEIYIAVK